MIKLISFLPCSNIQFKHSHNKTLRLRAAFQLNSPKKMGYIFALKFMIVTFDRYTANHIKYKSVAN